MPTTASTNGGGSMRRIWPVAILFASAGAIGACSRSDPEKELRATIAQMETAVEQRQVADFAGHFADDFTRESGGFDKRDARRVLAAAVLRNEHIQLTTAISDVRIDGNSALAKVRVIATGGSGLIPERGQTWEFDTAWRRDGRHWKIFNAEWHEGP